MGESRGVRKDRSCARSRRRSPPDGWTLSQAVLPVLALTTFYRHTPPFETFEGLPPAQSDRRCGNLLNGRLAPYIVLLAAWG